MHLTHYDDGKDKFQSHEICLREDDNFNLKVNNDYLCSHDLQDICGYGATKEQALEDFKYKFSAMMEEYKAIEVLLFETNQYTDSIIEVDCCGKEIK
jgi:hypothetical protein